MTASYKLVWPDQDCGTGLPLLICDFKLLKKKKEKKNETGACIWNTSESLFIILGFEAANLTELNVFCSNKWIYIHIGNFRSFIFTKLWVFGQKSRSGSQPASLAVEGVKCKLCKACSVYCTSLPCVLFKVCSMYCTTAVCIIQSVIC